MGLILGVEVFFSLGHCSGALCPKSQLTEQTRGKSGGKLKRIWNLSSNIKSKLQKTLNLYGCISFYTTINLAGVTDQRQGGIVVNTSWGRTGSDLIRNELHLTVNNFLYVFIQRPIKQIRHQLFLHFINWPSTRKQGTI